MTDHETAWDKLLQSKTTVRDNSRADGGVPSVGYLPNPSDAAMVYLDGFPTILYNKLHTNPAHSKRKA